MSSILFTETAFAQYKHWQEQDRRTLKKINSLLKSICRDGAMFGEGKPEKLKHVENEYSRRIDSGNRLVYSISRDLITVISCKGHYDD